MLTRRGLVTGAAALAAGAVGLAGAAPHKRMKALVLQNVGGFYGFTIKLMDAEKAAEVEAKLKKLGPDGCTNGRKEPVAWQFVDVEEGKHFTMDTGGCQAEWALLRELSL